MQIIDFIVKVGLYEWIGYLASVLVLISILMSSLVKLRIINLAGSLIFSIYGFLIGALPIGLMNAVIVGINLFYLYKMYKMKEYFEILPIESESEFLRHFLEFHRNDIAVFFTEEKFIIKENTTAFFILRNMIPAGLFIAHNNGDGELEVELDYVIPEYRDFKIGKYLYKDQKNIFINQGIKTLTACSDKQAHEKYLLRMGFEHIGSCSSESDGIRRLKIDLD